MAEIAFNCGSCGQTLEAPEEMANAVVGCPACGNDITVPASAEAPAVETAPAAALAAGACPECAAPMEADSILCVQCGFHTGLGKKISTDLG